MRRWPVEVEVVCVLDTLWGGLLIPIRLRWVHGEGVGESPVTGPETLRLGGPGVAHDAEVP